jgi:hypothetical protein
MYKFKFKHPEIEEYFYTKVIDPSRISTEDCIKQGLPYVDNNGDIRNTEAFSKVGNRWMEYGSYTDYPQGSKDWNDFWVAQRTYCRKGIWVGQVRITKYYYYFLNFYPMLYEVIDKESGESMVDTIVPKFLTTQFWLSHLFEYADYIKENFAFIKVRGMGASEFFAAVNACNFHVSPINSKGNKVDTNITTFGADDHKLRGEDGIFLKFTNAVNWLNEYGEKAMLAHPNHTMNTTKMHWVAGYRSKGDNTAVRTGGSSKFTIIESPDTARSGRTRYVLWEEASTIGCLGKALNVGMPLTRRLDKVTGIHCIWGTSATSSKGVEEFQKVLTRPRAYNCLQFENIFQGLEKEENRHKLKDIPKSPFEYMLHIDATDTKAVGWFVPYFDIKSFDKDGIPDREKGYDDVMKERAKKLGGGADDTETDIISYIADHPVTMEEALYKKGSNRFDQNKLAKQYQDLTVLKVYEEMGIKVQKGNLHWVLHNPAKEINIQNIKGVSWEPNNKGKVHVLEPPIWYNHQTKQYDVHKLYDDLYCAGMDSIDQGSSDSSAGKKGSKLALIVKKRNIGINQDLQDLPVCIYEDRPELVDTAYMEALKVLIWYNSRVLLEYTKIGFKPFLERMKMRSKLYHKPSMFSSSGNKNKNILGAPATAKNNEIMDQYIQRYISESYNKIMFPELLEEARDYSVENRSKEHDKIVAWGLVEIMDEDLFISGKLPQQREQVKDDIEMPVWYKDRTTGSIKFGKDPYKRKQVHQDFIREEEEYTDYIDINWNTRKWQPK